VEVELGDDNSQLVASCAAVCPLDATGQMVADTSSAGACAGVGCCKANIVLGYDFYSIQLSKLKGSVFLEDHPASAVYLVDKGFSNTEDIGIHGFRGRYPEALPATLEWVISKGTCASKRQNGTVPECRSAHSVCLEGSNNIANPGYSCACADGYQGNPCIIDGWPGMSTSLGYLEL